MRARGADGPFSSKALMKATSFDHSVSCRREDLSHMRCVVAATSYSNQLPQLTLRLNGPYGSMSGLISSKLPLHAYNQQIPSKRIICAIPLQQDHPCICSVKCLCANSLPLWMPVLPYPRPQMQHLPTRRCMAWIKREKVLKLGTLAPIRKSGRSLQVLEGLQGQLGQMYI